MDSVTELDNPMSDQFVLNYLVQYKVTLLDASSRLDVASRTSTYDLEDGFPSNALQKLYTHRSARKKLREAFKYVFETDILLDYSSLQKFRLKVADEFESIEDHIIRPVDNVDEAMNLDNQGAGYRGLAGVVLGVLLSQDRVILLDEPEAFLHPAQARRFGVWLADNTSQINGQLIISTHNAHFLSGVLSGGTDIQIYRLNRVEDTTRYNGMPPDVTSNLASDPLLSSQRVIDSVFHRGVVVCEADSDSTIYRYSTEKSINRGQYLFTYGHNKQTIPRVTSAMNDVGVPHAAIADIDVIKEPATVRGIITSMQSGHTNLHNLCNQFNQKLRESEYDWSHIKGEGISALEGELKGDLQQIIDDSAEQGLFIVPVGELEGWIDLEESKGPRWVVGALDYINDEGAPEPLAAFVQGVADYLENEYEDLVRAR